MQNLARHIEQLLAQYDCVIIPNFGGFVANHESAEVRGNLLLPPSRSVLFNSLLTYNDGLLAQSYMREEGIPFPQAMKKIAGAMAQIRKTLAAEGELTFGNVGTFLQKNGHIAFFANEKLTQCALNYGLKKLLFPPLENERRVSVDWRTWTSVAAMLLLIFLPLNLRITNYEPAEKASFSSIIDEMNASAETLLVVEKTNEFPADSLVAANADSLLLDSLAFLLEIPAETAMQENSISEPEAEISNANYHIIIASLPSLAKAHQYEREMVGYSFSFNIVQAGGRFRMSVADFVTEGEAEQFLQNFTAQYSEFSSAWIFEEN